MLPPSQAVLHPQHQQQLGLPPPGVLLQSQADFLPPVGMIPSPGAPLLPPPVSTLPTPLPQHPTLATSTLTDDLSRVDRLEQAERQLWKEQNTRYQLERSVTRYFQAEDPVHNLQISISLYFIYGEKPGQMQDDDNDSRSSGSRSPSRRQRRSRSGGGRRAGDRRSDTSDDDTESTVSENSSDSEVDRRAPSSTATTEDPALAHENRLKKDARAVRRRQLKAKGSSKDYKRAIYASGEESAVIRWQEKIFSPAEALKYRDVDPEKAAELDKKYAETIQEMEMHTGHAYRGNTICTLVDDDLHTSSGRYSDSKLSLRDSRLVHKLKNPQSKKGPVLPEPPAYREMVLCAAVDGASMADGSAWAGGHVEELCRIRYYPNGSLEMTPGFNKGVLGDRAGGGGGLGGDFAASKLPQTQTPVSILAADGGRANLVSAGGKSLQAVLAPSSRHGYRFITPKGNVYEYVIEKAVGPPVLPPRRLPVNTKTPAEILAATTHNVIRKNKKKMFMMGQIATGHGFEWDDLYVQYQLELPNSWKTRSGARLASCSQISSGKYEEGHLPSRNIAHWNMPFEVEAITKDTENLSCALDTSTIQAPILYLCVCSYDYWDRYRVQGYGHVQLPEQPGMHKLKVRTWRPSLSQRAELQQFFVGGSAELNDIRECRFPLDFQGRGLSKFGLHSEPSGFVKIELSVITQQKPKFEPYHPPPERSRHVSAPLVADPNQPPSDVDAQRAAQIRQTSQVVLSDLRNTVSNTRMLLSNIRSRKTGLTYDVPQ